MGTNYFHRTNICEKCGRHDERHIGKSSMGWVFTFQAYGNNDIEDNEPVIMSYKDWLKALEAGGKIFDEYGEETSLDDFKAMVERKRDSPHNQALEYPDRFNFVDDEGNSFSLGYFS